MQKLDSELFRKVTSLIHQRYGYDFSNYAEAPLLRRIEKIITSKHLSVKELMQRLEDHQFFTHEFLEEILVRKTELFRDPDFWRVVRDNLLTELAAKKSNLTIWLAGCSSGEEVISLSILLSEAGLSDRTKIIGSDMSFKHLKSMQEGRYDSEPLAASERNYKLSGGKKEVKNYFKTLFKTAEFNQELLHHVVYIEQDLVKDPVPQPSLFDLIICRNVLIYFNKDLQNQVIACFYNSLMPGGFLAMGSNESLLWFDQQHKFKPIDKENKIFQRS